MANFINSLSIRGFRTLSRLDVDSFGKVNLITGKNNAGKSSVLEAIRILTSGGSMKTLLDILTYRDELSPPSEAERSWSRDDFSPLNNLFTGFPSLIKGSTAFAIRAEGTLPPQLTSVDARLGWFTRREDPPTYAYDEVESDLFADGEVFPALSLNLGNRKRVLPLDRFQRRSISRFEPDAPNFPCIYLDPFSSRSTSQMGALWDSIALTDVEPEIVKALQIVSQDIQAVSVVGGGERLRGRTAIAKSTEFEYPVPLRTFGDGVNRLFGIILSLCSARNGILLVDEIENGLHYSAQAEIWLTIFRLAEDLNVQVFATTHSWDCVQAFQQAASDSWSNGALLRLSKLGGEIIPTLFSEFELEIATRDQIEVR